MQSTGHSSTHPRSSTSTQGWPITYVIFSPSIQGAVDGDLGSGEESGDRAEVGRLVEGLVELLIGHVGHHCAYCQRRCDDRRHSFDLVEGHACLDVEAVGLEAEIGRAHV